MKINAPPHLFNLNSKGFSKVKLIASLAIGACVAAVGIPLYISQTNEPEIQNTMSVDNELSQANDSVDITLQNSSNSSNEVSTYASARATKCEVCGQTHTKAEPKDGKTYTNNNSVDYIYTYHTNNHGWSVRVKDSVQKTGKTKTYAKILSVIDTYPVVDMTHCFDECANMATAPVIPDTVWDLTAAFANCTALTTTPVIPDSVTNMNNTFHGCTALTDTPTIPENVQYMNWTFRGCTSLEGQMLIEADVFSYKDCFWDTVKPIVLNGHSQKLYDLAETDNNGNVTVGKIGSQHPDGLPCEVETHTKDDGLDHWTEVAHITDYYATAHRYTCLCTCWQVPTNGRYRIYSTGTDYSGGKLLPCEYKSQDGDTYVEGDYIYTYQSDMSGWRVQVWVGNENKTTYGAIREDINGKPIVSMKSTFIDCANMTESPVIPNTVVTLYQTYRMCTSLRSAPVIPANVVDMTGTFFHCTAMKTYVNSTATDGDFSNFTVPNTVIDMTYTFRSCEQMILPPVMPTKLVDMTGTFYACTFLTTAPKIPTTVTTINSCFNYCSSLNGYIGKTNANGDFSGYTIPKSVTNMGGTFSHCLKITKPPALPSKVTFLGGTFCGCTALTIAPKIPDSATDMDSMFQECSSLTGYIGKPNANGDFSGYVLPSKMTSLFMTFQDCDLLTKAPKIPSTVTNMYQTFAGCYSLTTAPIIPNGVTNMCNTFYDCYALETYTGSKDADGDFSNWVIPNTVENMWQTFHNCYYITTAPVIPASVQNIGCLFLRCFSLTGTVVINANPTNYESCFEKTTLPIVLTGSSKMLKEIAATANNNNVTVG